MLRRVAIEERCNFAHCILCALHLNIGDAVLKRLRHVLAENSLGTELQSLRDELMTVCLRAFHSYEEMTVLDLT